MRGPSRFRHQDKFFVRCRRRLTRPVLKAPVASTIPEKTKQNRTSISGNKQRLFNVKGLKKGWCKNWVSQRYDIGHGSNFKEGHMISAQESWWKEEDWNGCMIFISIFIVHLHALTAWPYIHYEQWYNTCYRDGRNCQSTPDLYISIIYTYKYNVVTIISIYS